MHTKPMQRPNTEPRSHLASRTLLSITSRAPYVRVAQEQHGLILVPRIRSDSAFLKLVTWSVDDLPRVVHLVAGHDDLFPELLTVLTVRSLQAPVLRAMSAGAARRSDLWIGAGCAEAYREGEQMMGSQ